MRGQPSRDAGSTAIQPRANRFQNWIIHPFLFGVYPVTNLLAHNISQIMPVFAARSFLAALGLTGFSLLLFRLILRDWQKAALVTSAAGMLFFTYGLAKDALEGLSLWGIAIDRHRELIAIWGILLLAWIWLVVKKIGPPAWTGYFNATGIIAILLPLVSIGIYAVEQGRAVDERIAQGAGAAPVTAVPAGQPLPDIYYIILDTYTRQDTLAERFGFDNSPFIAELRQRGFYVADCSRSNYSSTVPSLASSLNMDYLEALDPALASPKADTDALYPYLQNSAVWRLADSLGYTRIALDTGFSPTNFTDADAFLTQEGSLWAVLSIKGLTSFETLLLQTSAGRIIYDHYKNTPEKAVFFDYAYIIYRNRILFALDQLEEIPRRAGPKFVFAHILAPHNPFVFGPNGEELIRWSPFTLNSDLDSLVPGAYVSGYTGELTYLNERVLAFVDEMLSQAERAPIIIIQGDHGSPRVREDMNIFNAYYLPGDQASAMLYPSISPVNSFRVVLDAYFGARLPLLPDVACHSTPEEPLRCTSVKDYNPSCLVP